MPEVVAVQSGPLGRASNSWDILQQPSPEEALGEQPKTESRPEPRSEPDSKTEKEPETPAPVKDTGGQEQQQAEASEPKDGEPEHKEKLSRYERTKRQRKALEAWEKENERQAKELKAREAEFAKREQAFAESERKRAQPPYTVKELKGYRKVWEKEGRYDLVEQADSEITRLEQLEASEKSVVEIPRSGTPEFTNQWESAEKELYQLDPEFQREGTRLDKVLRAMMTGPDGAVYRQHPRGIVAAYHRARLDIAEADLGAARTEIQKLRNEVTRLNGLTSVGGSGGAGRSVADMRGKDFANMSTKEMRDYLKRHATRGHW